MTARSTTPGDPFEAALVRHLKATSEPVPPRLFAAVDQALRQAPLTRPASLRAQGLARPQRSTLSFAAVLAVVLAAAGVLTLGQLGRGPQESPAELIAPGASPSAAVSAEPTSVVLGDGTEIDPEVAVAIESLLASTELEEPTMPPELPSRTVELDIERLAELPGSPDPLYLIDDDRNGALYIDRTDGTVHRANLKNGKVAPVVRSGQGASGGPRIGRPTQLARADYVVIVDDMARPFRWSPSNSAGAGTLARIKLNGQTAFGAGHGDVEAYDPPVGNYRLYVADPAAAQVMKYTQNFDGSSFSEPVTWLVSPSAEVAAADQIYIDFDMYALLEDETIRRYVAGKWDGDFVPRDPPSTSEGAAVDYRILAGSGSDSSLGRLYAYDAANARIVGISKVDGRFMREWVVPDGGPELDDVRGMYVVEGGLNGRRTARRADQLVWITPDGIYRATLKTPPLR